MKQIYLSLLIWMMGMACCTQPLRAQDSSRNYIRTRTMLDSRGTRHTDLIQYYDGLGRPNLSLQKNQAPSGAHWATLLEYDSLGNESLNWLPAVVKAEYIKPSLLKDSISLLYGEDSRPYAETKYEASLLSRVSRKYHPGADWKDHPARTEYYANCDSFPLSCTDYSVSSNGSLVAGGMAPACKYKVLKNTDEDGADVYTFTNGLDNEVLVRRMNGAVAYDTYYVYDSYDRLRYVLPPAYSDDANLDRYAYRYQYDGLGRCIEKQLPGCSPIRYVYDQADRLIFSQDGKQRKASEWTFYLYDSFSRLLVQGTCTNPSTASIPNMVVKCTISRGANRQMTSGSGLWDTPYMPNITLPSPKPQIVNYYDDYTFLSLYGFTDSSRYPAGSFNATGQLTGSRVYSTDNAAVALCSVHYYDVKGQLSRTVSRTYSGGYETEEHTYTFTGNPLELTRTHEAPGNAIHKEVYAYQYDHAERQTSVRYRLGNSAPILLYRNVYDELGRLQKREYPNPTDSTRLITSTGYTYDIRGWLSAITGDKFSQTLHYADGVGTPRYNGNISGMTWKGGTETVTRGYKFSYDNLNRLTDAVYGEGSNLTTNLNRFNEQVTGYDKMGNILSLKRNGQTSSTTYGAIDNLTLSYTGNQLRKVTDAVAGSTYNNSFGFNDGSNAATEYTYDENGNLTKDLNKKILEIQYNYLNLPSRVAFEDGSSISYVYDANGTKLRTTHVINGTTTTTDYCGNVIYENGVAKTLLTEVGYISLSDNKYHYYLQDHQGNNRVVMNQSGTVEEVNHYYPFGGIFASTGNVQAYKYNGKELDRKSGLDWYDYGARYYDAVLGRFMVTDRFSEKYSSLSPYQYAANSPVNNLDINGDSIAIGPNPNGFIDQIKQFLGFDTKYQEEVRMNILQLKMDNEEVSQMITELERSSNIHYITMPKNKRRENAANFDKAKAEKGISQGSIIEYDPYKETDIKGEKRAPRVGLSHELKHSHDADRGTITYAETENGVKLMEVRAVNVENKIRIKTGDPRRSRYGGKEIPKKYLE